MYDKVVHSEAAFKRAIDALPGVPRLVRKAVLNYENRDFGDDQAVRNGIVIERPSRDHLGFHLDYQGTNVNVDVGPNSSPIGGLTKDESTFFHELTTSNDTTSWGGPYYDNGLEAFALINVAYNGVLPFGGIGSAYAGDVFGYVYGPHLMSQTIVSHG